jgi:outer membrane lipoprotein-sorting protein
MKKLFLALAFLSLQVNLAQNNPKVENHRSEKMDLILFTFGMMDPINIGTMTNTGDLTIKFPKDLNFITDEEKANFMSDAAFTFFRECSNSYDILTESENIKAINAGYISLSTKDNSYAGLLNMVTDENMVPWLEESYSNNAVIGSYFELVYMESDFKYQGECNSRATNTEDDTIETLYTYNLELKAGFNFIEYTIESVKEHKIPSMYEEGAFDNIAKPSKIKVTSTQATPPNTKWIGKYF